MKNLFAISALALALFPQQPCLAQDKAATRTSQPASKARKLTRAEIDGLLARPADVLFIDVRRPDEISSIGGFPVYLSIQIGDLESHLSDIPKDRLIVTVSNHAGRAGKAADLLAEKGFRVAGAVGVQSYEAEGGQVTKVAVPALTASQ